MDKIIIGNKIIIVCFPGIYKIPEDQHTILVPAGGMNDDSDMIYDLVNLIYQKIETPDQKIKLINDISISLQNGRNAIIFLSYSHQIMDILRDASWESIIVTPLEYLKEDYIKIYHRSGKPSNWIMYMMKNWDSIISEIRSIEDCHIKKYFFGKDVFLDETFLKQIIYVPICTGEIEIDIAKHE